VECGRGQAREIGDETFIKGSLEHQQRQGEQSGVGEWLTRRACCAPSGAGVMAGTVQSRVLGSRWPDRISLAPRRIETISAVKCAL
jgi:hypothetical protein